jgi:hypothetical protein
MWQLGRMPQMLAAGRLVAQSRLALCTTVEVAG